MFFLGYSINGEKIMGKIDFNLDWKYKHLDTLEEFTSIRLPFDAMFKENRKLGAPGGINVSYFEGRDYLFKKNFKAEKSYEDKDIYIEFEAVYKDSQIFVNGKKAGGRNYGYEPIFIKLNEFLKYGEDNTIEVRCYNSDQPNSRWYSGAGIIRPCYLYVLPKNHILEDDIRITTLSTDPGKISLSFPCSDTCKGIIRITDSFNKEIYLKDALLKINNEIAIDIPSCHLWSSDSPYLYTLEIEIEGEIYSRKFGIRKIEYGKDGLLINGKREILFGACIHSDEGILGAASFKEAEYRKIRLLKQYGYNSIRSSHNPCSKFLLEACDEYGVYVLDEYVDCWFFPKTKYDYTIHLMKNYRTDLYDMVKKDYSHPSVIMYSIGNEVTETARKEGIILTEDMVALLHSFDKTRPVTCGINICMNGGARIGFGFYNKKSADKQALNNAKTKKTGSELFNLITTKIGGNTIKTFSALKVCDLGTKEAFSKLDIAGYNYGIKRYRKDLKEYPDRLILGTETFLCDADKFYKLAMKEKRIIGDFVWAGIDYLGEVGIGSWEYKDYASDFAKGLGWISAGSGRLDLNGNPLGEALYTMSSFHKTNKPLIGICPFNHYKEKHSPSVWKMSGALPYYSYKGYEGRKGEIEVYSTSPYVKLFINLKDYGIKKTRNGIARFKVRYREGFVKAINLDRNRKEGDFTVIYSPLEETYLSLIKEGKDHKIGDLVYINVAYTDKNGSIKPLERHQVSLKLTGCNLMAFGNSCPFHKNGYSSLTEETYHGQALAIVEITSSLWKVEASDGKLTSQVK